MTMTPHADADEDVCVCARNVHRQSNERAVRSLFACCGEMVSVTMAPDPKFRDGTQKAPLPAPFQYSPCQPPAVGCYAIVWASKTLT